MNVWMKIDGYMCFSCEMKLEHSCIDNKYELSDVILGCGTYMIIWGYIA